MVTPGKPDPQVQIARLTAALERIAAHCEENAHFPKMAAVGESARVALAGGLAPEGERE